MRLIVAIFCLVALIQAAAQNAGDDEYVTGMTVVGRATSDCPPIVWLVTPDTPAAQAGIRPGDRLLAVDGRQVLGHLDTLAALLRPKEPKNSKLELEGEHGIYTVTVGRISQSALVKKEGWKLGPDGIYFSPDATDAEMKRVAAMPPEPPPNSRVFPKHYPDDPGLYYPGFEAFVWQDHPEVDVGGIEEGPAKRAGVHFLDKIVSINGVNPLAKSIVQLELLLSSAKPSSMTLEIDRDGVKKSFTFELEKVSDVLRDNKKRFYKGKVIPSVIPDAYLHCFDPKPTSPQ